MIMSIMISSEHLMNNDYDNLVAREVCMDIAILHVYKLFVVI